MGIPFYFSYIIKNHRTLLKRYTPQTIQVDNFFIDANPLIYNSVKKSLTTHETIVENVIEQINELISTFSPQKKIFIAFDGVAPVSKLEQQRGRRYKRRYELPEPSKENPPDTDTEFNTIEITPGTEFMKYLNEEIFRYFNDNPAVIYTGSNVCGEGEHKIFQYIRDNQAELNTETNIIYGLDADLIMLSLNHLNITPNIYLFRETPHFIQSIDDTLIPNETYILDISALSHVIHSNVGLTYKDYILVCFLLGNDFLPHFPAINIRTGGVMKLLDTYKETMNPELQFVRMEENGPFIQWSTLKTFLKELAKKEKKYILDELSLRDRKQRNYYPSNTREELQKKINDLPTYERELENSIQPNRSGWQDRYYVSLFGLKRPPNKDFIKAVCKNYLEGLEWTLKYYTRECPDWRWTYKYCYPPLLEDLIKHIPEDDAFSYFGNEGVSEEERENRRRPIHEITQLCYVLPTEHLDLIPENVKNIVKGAHPEWYIGEDGEVDFIWAFCKYFFEAHPILPHIDINELERLVEDANL